MKYFHSTEANIVHTILFPLLTLNFKSSKQALHTTSHNPPPNTKLHKDEIFALNRSQHCSHYTIFSIIHFESTKQALHTTTPHQDNMHKDDEIFALRRKPTLFSSTRTNVFTENEPAESVP